MARLKYDVHYGCAILNTRGVGHYCAFDLIKDLIVELKYKSVRRNNNKYNKLGTSY